MKYLLISLMLLASFSCGTESAERERIKEQARLDSIIIVNTGRLDSLEQVRINKRNKIDSFPYYMEKMLDYHGKAKLSELEWRLTGERKHRNLYKRYVDSNNKYFSLMQNVTK